MTPGIKILIVVGVLESVLLLVGAVAVSEKSKKLQAQSESNIAQKSFEQCVERYRVKLSYYKENHYRSYIISGGAPHESIVTDACRKKHLVDTSAFTEYETREYLKVFDVLEQY